MFVSQVTFILVSLLNAGLGLFVLSRNPTNIVNQRFCVFASVLSVWVFFVFLTISTTDPVSATYRLRLVFSAAFFIPSAFFSFSSIFPDRVERPFDRKLSIFFLAISALLAPSSYYIVESVSFEKQSHHAHYSPLFGVFWLYFIPCMAYSLYSLYKKSLNYYGVKRLQIQYLYLGVAIFAFIASITNFILPAIGIWQAERFVPLLTVPILTTVAYAIVKYDLMDISLVIKRGTVYGTLSILLSTIYFIVGLVLGSILPVSEYKETVTAVISTTVLVLTFVPARESIQHIMEKTLFRTKYSHPKILRDSTVMFSSIHDLNGLLHYAIQSLYGSIGIEKICILLKNQGAKYYTLRASINFSPEENLSLPSRDVVVTWLRQNRTVLSIDQLSRFTRGTLDHLAEDTLSSLGVDSCIPIFQEDDLFGIILLGKKIDKKTFTQEDVQMFLAFSGQLAMAIHNANLYAGLKDAKIYRDNILQSLRSGVIVVDSNEVVTFVNNEAKRILGLKEQSSSEKIQDHLGEYNCQLLRHTIRSDVEYHDIESFVERENKKIPCSVTTVQLDTETGGKQDALMILTDLTELKLLQAEKQHADRLASLGALAANIAHEIKNPLVAINTYFQLLPYKKDDAEFHGNFQKIAAKELKRINRILEEMLNLAKPSKPVMHLIDPHCAIRDALNLLKNATVEKSVEITTDFEEKICKLIADEEQIKQVIINLLHNALDAVTENGHINVSTDLKDSLSEFRKTAKIQPGTVFFSFASPSLHNQTGRQYFVIKVSDNGIGITEEKMHRLFEPFFTTKDKGTGIGLAIIYGIMKNHKGSIFVESREEKGTDFYLCLPLTHLDASASKVNTMPN